MERQFKKTQNPKALVAEEKGETNDIVLTFHDSAISSREALKNQVRVTSSTARDKHDGQYQYSFDAETALFSGFT
ncbi:uncharacterized protein EAE98_002222 [Botrytis deweyae]|uniref:Uncharacterized protein n=1 Tax=Botrytis deweyae TaxID=2478750 RepID=A0ABQ7IWK0_9HELO|nr:uncharacterized protein EAE98_002222 [Botrytis deweyae]KAF7936003.1 hypothetical protein EAE98_002222 [Botrytis deweyae]